jgi:N-methylhydantoinase A
MRGYRLGCDIGGTFTDFAVLDEKDRVLHTAKVLSTPDDPSRAVLHGLETFIARIPDVHSGAEHVLHATTLAINAILERRGAPTAVLATRGFRDVLEMRRSRRADVADIFGDPPQPLVPREHRYEIDERIWSDGRVLRPLDREQASRQIRAALGAGIRSFAVALLHSYVNPAHERALAELIQEIDASAYVSLSCDVLPEAGEYERTSSTTINAFVQPVMDRYIDRLKDGMASSGFGCPLQLMLSGGGLASAETARDFPVRLIESGAAAGVMAANYFRNLLRLRSVLVFDMGGTTAKISIVQDGHVPITSDLEVARAYRFKKGTGLPVNVPSVDILEIGAGGGSIASINETGSLQVGPRSAGADPGPICYGRGGAEPTVTDAAAVLGYLDPDYFLGGDMALDIEAARAGIAHHIAEPLGVSVDEAAFGIHEIVCENMAGAISAHIAEWGGDPSNIALIAFGGAGPVHAYTVARKVGIARIVLPTNPGVMSAVGLLTAPTAYDLSRTYRIPLNETNAEQIGALFTEMEEQAAAILRTTGTDQTPTVRRQIEMCYVGQGLALPITVEGAPGRTELAERFNAAYQARYGYAYPNVAIGLVRLRLRAEVEGAGLDLNAANKDDAAQAVLRRKVFCPGQRSWADYPVHRRNDIDGNFRSDEPIILEDVDSTMVVGPDAAVSVGQYNVVTITLKDIARVDA